MHFELHPRKTDMDSWQVDNTKGAEVGPCRSTLPSVRGAPDSAFPKGLHLRRSCCNEAPRRCPGARQLRGELSGNFPLYVYHSHCPTEPVMVIHASSVHRSLSYNLIRNHVSSQVCLLKRNLLLGPKCVNMGCEA